MHGVPAGGCPSPLGWDREIWPEMCCRRTFLYAHPPLPTSSTGNTGGGWGLSVCSHSAGAWPWHRPALLFTPSWHRFPCLQGPVGISSNSPSLALLAQLLHSCLRHPIPPPSPNPLGANRHQLRIHPAGSLWPSEQCAWSLRLRLTLAEHCAFSLPPMLQGCSLQSLPKSGCCSEPGIAELQHPLLVFIAWHDARKQA